mgnify:CR=1 FL=1
MSSEQDPAIATPATTLSGERAIPPDSYDEFRKDVEFYNKLVAMKPLDFLYHKTCFAELSFDQVMSALLHVEVLWDQIFKSFGFSINMLEFYKNHTFKEFRLILPEKQITDIWNRGMDLVCSTSTWLSLMSRLL